LRDGPHRAEEGILVAAGPAGHEHAQFRARADGEEEQQARLRQVERDHVPAKWQHGVSQQHGDEQRDGGEEVDDLVRRARDDIFLDERLDAVGDELAKARKPDVRERDAHAVGPDAVLDAAQALALNDRGEREEQREDREDG